MRVRPTIREKVASMIIAVLPRQCCLYPESPRMETGSDRIYHKNDFCLSEQRIKVNVALDENADYEQ